MEREQLIELFKGLRVTDVCDAMDAVGLMGRGLVSRDVRPLYRDVEGFSHRIAGPALTARFLPTNRPVPNMPPDQFRQWVGDWYRNISPESYRPRIRPGDVVVLDAADMDVGFIGSNNCLAWMAAGAVGVVTNAGARDTDELIKQKCPVYCRFISRVFKPGRLEMDAVGIPVNCGGVMVRPGDMVVADGDGVIVVPAEQADQVGRIAAEVQAGDKKTRRELYRKRGLAMDSTVEE